MEPPTGPNSGIDEGPGSIRSFSRPPALVEALNETEEAIRQRLARVRLFERIFLLRRDWMTRITMLMLILSVFWGAVGAFDAFGFQAQVVAYATSGTVELSNQEIYSSLTLHGIRMLFGFAQQLEMAFFGFLLVNVLSLTPRHKWRLYSSVALINLSIILIEGPIYLVPFNDNYFPAEGWYFLSPLGLAHQSLYVVSPLFYLGWLALCAAVLLWTWWMFSHLLTWYRAQPAATRRLPVFLLFILATLVLLPLTYVPLVVSTVWDLGTYFGNWPINPLLNQVIFWMFGHGIVYILFLIPITGLYLLLPILARRPPYSYRWAFVAAIMFVVLTPLLGIHHLYLAPVPSWSVWLTMVFSFLVIVPSAITFFSLWMTLKGVPRAQWEWNGVALFALLAFAGSILGGLSGPVVATVPWDVDVHNSLFILSHFHSLTVLSITGGGFALVYAFFPILTGRSWYSGRLALVHFLLTAVGGLGLVLSFDELGSLGVLRRAFIVPALPEITFYQLVLFASIIVLLGGQLFFVLNGFLTVFFGDYFSAAGLTFDEAVRKAAQSTCATSRRVPVADVPFVRRVPRVRRERAERYWVVTVLVLIVVLLAMYTPSVFSTSNAIGSPSAAPAGSEFVTLSGHQYYWAVTESGRVNGTFDNAIVAFAGQWISVNATASGATQDLYLPFRGQSAVSVQVVPGSRSYALFEAPSTPGVYGSPDGEYDGPWFGQDAAALIVLPTAGAFPTLAAFEANGGAGDIYNPPVRAAATADLVGDNLGLFNSSVPGPTLTASAGPVAFSWTVPLSSIGVNSYLVNVTSSDPNAQRAYVVAHNYTLPFAFGIWAIDPATGLAAVTSAPLAINAPESETATLGAGAYLYGIIQPIDYSYDPSGDSGTSTGSDAGLVMGLWGVLWVSA
jgi:heme/copper-type cytochrome/quinol oxidase subunit 1